MTRNLIFILLFILAFKGSSSAQAFIRTSDLFSKEKRSEHSGQLNIIQDQEIDTLISRYILANENTYRTSGRYGMAGFRIQIYSSSNRTAKEESNKINADFMSKFHDIRSYTLFAQPAYYKVRVGDFRTKTEATKLFLLISKEFPDSYLVPDIINFPDLNIK